MKTLLSIAAALMLAAAPAALAQSSSVAGAAAQAMTKVDTATFVKTVASANAFEIQSSQIALTKGPAEDVGAFAELMIQDHTKAGEEFKTALAQVDMTSATDPAILPEQAAMLKELEGAEGDDFQAKYIAMQTEAHKQAVALFRSYSEDGDDPALKEFAKKTLPTLEMHEAHVNELIAAHPG